MSRTPTAPARGREPATTPHVNEVRLVGRVSAPPQTLVLPSGDEIVTFRLVVERARPRPTARGSRVTVDTFEICCWPARPRQRAATLQPGDTVLVEGALQRRFYRSAQGPASRYQVDADRVRREVRADPPSEGGAVPEASRRLGERLLGR